MSFQHSIAFVAFFKVRCLSKANTNQYFYLKFGSLNLSVKVNVNVTALMYEREVAKKTKKRKTKKNKNKNKFNPKANITPMKIAQ